jgi:tagatose-1,6-bisphosphate aldolase non-catalytic subunit AgaZ/GatZ
MSAPGQFYKYVKENDELDEFYTVSDCIRFIDNDATAIFSMVDYLETKTDDIPKDLIQQFNLCQYFVAQELQKN